MDSVKVLSSGIQPANSDALAVSDRSYAYISTLGLYMLQPETLTLKHVISVTNKPYMAVAYTSDALIAVTAENKIISVNHEGRVTREVRNFAPSIPAFLEISDNNQILVGLLNGDVYTVTSRLTLDRKLFSTDESEISCIRALGDRLLVGSQRGSVALVEISSGKALRTWSLGKTGPVTDVQFDVLSSQFFLVASESALGLYQTESEICLTNFQHPGKPSQIQWVPSMPGNFLTFTAARPGIFLLWNARRGASPLSELRVGSFEISGFRVHRHASLVFFGQANGAVGVYDVQSRTVLRMAAAGHTETVFDCAFDPEDPEILATASYDGRVKLWRLCDASLHREFFAGKDQQLYGLSLAGERLAACSQAGTVFVWNKKRGDLISRCEAHAGTAIRVKLDEQGERVVSGGQDDMCVISRASDGVVLGKLKHPSAVFGCLFKGESEILTACEDGVIRLWRLAGKTSEIVQEFRGHKAKVFNLAVNPILNKYFASSSDDMCVNVWNFQAASQNALVARLQGHQAVTRAVVWHPEIPSILFSGSWDASIRVWDFTKAECLLAVSAAHQADIYGLALHPMRPFLLVSCSRDSTIKLWDTHKLLIGNLVDDLLANPQKLRKSPRLPQDDEDANLWGERSRKALVATENPKDAIRNIADLFIWREGLGDLCASAAREKKDDFVFHAHELHLLSTEISRANNRAAMASDGSASRLIGGVANTAAKRDQIFVQAATDLARAGDFSGACECFIAAEEWLKAMALAPAVSQDYWRKVLVRYNEAMNISNSACNLDEVAPFAVAAGHCLPLAHAYLSKYQVHKAVVSLLSGKLEDKGKRELVDKIVAKYVESGEIVKAAACLASFDGRQLEAVRLLRAWGESTIADAVEKLVS